VFSFKNKNKTSEMSGFSVKRNAEFQT